MALQFTQHDNGQGEFQESGPGSGDARRALEDLLDRRDLGQLADKAFLAGLEALVRQAPDLIDAHAHLAFTYFERDHPRKALTAAQAGLAQCHSLIPADFDGQIPWVLPGNRPFLRAQHAAVVACIRLGRHQDAADRITQMLRLNPDDNQGMRLLLGSECLRAGQPAQARALFEACLDLHPSYSYELALAHIAFEDWAPAATALRRGFAMNPYVAERLLGVETPEPMVIWHGSTLEQPEAAEDYLRTYGALWQDMSGAIPFLRWLLRHPLVMAERARLLESKENLRWERDGALRAAHIRAYQTALAQIDDTLSRRIVVKRTDLDGRTAYPWEFALRL